VANSPSEEIALDATAVRALLRDAAPHLEGLPLMRVADGWDNTIWRLGDDLAVRLPRRELAAALILREQTALAVFGPRLADIGIRAPSPVVCGRPGPVFAWPWSVVPWIDGQPALARSRTENSTWAPDLARVLGVLHQPAPAETPRNPVRGVPLARRDAALAPRLAQLADRPALREAWAAGLSAPSSTEFVWIHGDLHPGNVLVDDGALVALIDFGDVTAGDPAYDLAAGWMLFDEPGRAVFRHATGSRYDENTWVRARAWAAYIAATLLTESDDRAEYREIGASTADALAL